MAKTAPLFISMVVIYLIAVLVHGTSANPVQRLLQRRLSTTDPNPTVFNDFSADAEDAQPDGLEEPRPNLTRELVQALIGAATGDEGCLLQTACHAGAYARNINGKELVFIMRLQLLLIATLIAFCSSATVNSRKGKDYPIYSYEPTSNRASVQVVPSQAAESRSSGHERHGSSQSFVPYTPQQFQQGFGVVSSDDSFVSSEKENPLKSMWRSVKDTVLDFVGMNEPVGEKRSDSPGLNVELPDPISYTYQDPAGYSMQSGFEGYIVPSMPHLGTKGTITGLIIAVTVLSGILAVLLPLTLGWLTMLKHISVVNALKGLLRRFLPFLPIGRSGRELELENFLDGDFITELSTEVMKGISRLRDLYEKQ